MKDLPGINQIPVNSPPSGRVQRKIPAPYARPSISVGTPPEQRRDWRSIPAYALEVGDVIPSFGQVTRLIEAVYAPKPNSADTTAVNVRWEITVIGGEDNERVFHGDDQVWCFTKPIPAGYLDQAPPASL